MRFPRLLVAMMLSPVIAAAQSVPELPVSVALLLKTYATAPDGAGFFEVHSLAVDVKSPALWVRYGPETEPPVRIDRKTGQSKVIGRQGDGPNEYRRTMDLVENPAGGFGIWDRDRRLWFWVDGEGVQRRTWSLPTSIFSQNAVFLDDRGRVFIGQHPFYPAGAIPYLVRVDSARGLVDTMRSPFVASQKWIWETRSTSGGGQGGSKFQMPNSPKPDYGMDRRGRMYAYWSDSSFVQLQSGRQVSRLLLPMWRQPLSAGDRKKASDLFDRIEKNQRANNAEFLTPRPPIPETQAEILDVRPEMNGGLVIRRSRDCAQFSAWKAPITGAAPPDSGRCGWIERFDASGKRLTPFTIGPRDKLLAMRGDTAWIARSDEDDVVKILELLIPKR